MKSIIVFISNGYADFELGFICAELNRSKKFKISTVALTKEIISSMGGLKVIPDYSIDDLLGDLLGDVLKQNQDTCEIEMLLLCGGDIWKEFDYTVAKVKNLVDICNKNKVLISAICDATTFLAHNGYLNNVDHTGNSVEYISYICPNYTGSQHYIEKQCVSSENIITANGTATLEFAKEIMRHLNVIPDMHHLNIMPEKALEEWYKLNKNGYYAS